jgi:NADH-quinone oxidoreductase subunit F
MPLPTDQDLVTDWKSRPAPLLPLLHAFNDRDGYLSDEALRAVSQGLRIPLADLFGTVTFYHHFSRFPPGTNAPRVCTGQVCRFAGGLELLETMRKDGATPMPCAGRCDEPVPVLTGRSVQVGVTVGEFESRPSPLPVANPGGLEECVFAAIRNPGNDTLEGYRRAGGYSGYEGALGSDPENLLTVITDSGLAGRGGAGFPTGVKWRAVREALNPRPGDDTRAGPKSVVCNADEGEPGCFKDRVLMDHDPHAVLEGMALAGYAAGAEIGFIYLRYEYPETADILDRAITEAEDAGLLGENILGSGFSFRIHVRRGAGAYICGEEGSLLNSLEGKHPFPRERPPFPVTHGFENRPTVVNNVETLASAAAIARRGAEWYRGLGAGDLAGTKIISLSGDIMRPGNYEVPFGFPLQTLLNDWAGGPRPGRHIQAVTMAGISGGFLAKEDLDVTLDEPSVRSKGSMLGAGGIMVFDDSRDMLEVAHSCMEFFAHESCGKCFPCRIGTQRLTERLAGAAGPGVLAGWSDEVEDIGSVMKATSACGLGMAAPLITESLMRYFPEQVAAHVEATNS